VKIVEFTSQTKKEKGKEKNNKDIFSHFEDIWSLIGDSKTLLTVTTFDEW